MPEVGNKELQIIDLGLIPYKEAWDLQARLLQELIEHKKAGYTDPQKHYLLLFEHPPVVTHGKSRSEENLKLNDNERTFHQIEYFKINRGGDITFHGPGQLVGYPILDLDLIFTDVHKYVRSLEEVIIRVLSKYHVDGIRSAKYTGVWVQDTESMVEVKKICAIGVHLSRWVTMHGFAFNVNTDLSFFNHIIPCGISDPDKSVCSLSGLLGKDVNLQDIKDHVAKEFCSLFELNPNHSTFKTLKESKFLI